jgi:hypothetical protein
MRGLAALHLLAALPALALAQSCSNFANSSSTGCSCPPGLGGTDCSAITCDNPLLGPAQRAVYNGTGGAQGCQAAGQCTDGFVGLSCNGMDALFSLFSATCVCLDAFAPVCSSAQSCSTALSLPGVNSSAPATTPAGLAPQTNNTVVCNQSPFTYSEGFIACGVVNPTLQSSVFFYLQWFYLLS